MRQKFKILDILVKRKNMMEKQTGRKTKVLQIYSVGEYKDQFYDLKRTLVLIFSS